MVENDAIQYGLLAAVTAFVLVTGAEFLHYRRVTRAAPLAFGNRVATLLPVAAVVAVLRMLAFTAVAYGLTALFFLPAKAHRAGFIRESEYRHLVMVLDVSPSMQLEDAGPSGKQKRAERAADLIHSFFERVSAEKYKTTVIAVWTDAKPVVKDTADREVIRNILTELPMRHAFKAGETNIFAGLEQAAEIARPWNPGSAILMLITDGDTVPATGMPKMPASIGNNVAIIGVGSPTVGKNIAGHSSRQDVSTLRQVATRLSGTYHDGNEKHLSTDLVSRIDERATPPEESKFKAREIALVCVGVGTAIIALLPLALNLMGTLWTPGLHPREAARRFGVAHKVGVL